MAWWIWVAIALAIPPAGVMGLTWSKFQPTVGVRWAWQYALMWACFVLCPLAMALCLPALDPTTYPPGWFSALNTWDDTGPDQGENNVASVAWVRRVLGWRAKTWYWLGLRNQAYGLFHMLPGPTDWTTVSFSQSLPAVWIYTAQMACGGRGYFELHVPYVLRIGWKLKDMINASPPTPNDRPMFCFQPFKKPT